MYSEAEISILISLVMLFTLSLGVSIILLSRKNKKIRTLSAELLKEEIAFRIRLYSYCIMNNTKNYKEWLEEDYERKLRLKLSQMFAKKM